MGIAERVRKLEAQAAAAPAWRIENGAVVGEMAASEKRELERFLEMPLLLRRLRLEKGEPARTEGELAAEAAALLKRFGSYAAWAETQPTYGEILREVQEERRGAVSAANTVDTVTPLEAANEVDTVNEADSVSAVQPEPEPIEAEPAPEPEPVPEPEPEPQLPAWARTVIDIG